MAPNEPFPAEHCRWIVPSTLRTLLEPLILVALIVAYLPRYMQTARHGTSGISSRWILWLCLASNMQLASRLAAMRGWYGVQCILWPPGPPIREPFWFHVFGILLPYIEVAVQWVCAMILSV
ncbi:hypothetical protein CONLIGDRAFT_627854 [Coniochaeta ligniaria NRRL 30616]|uniref:Uncharacterized protein n=1 Tax=Coniochaeta ligniaria NRRL 30616 TaxID=1408157 RepID=A0A1J7JHS9_9PEZI|nr:hypothetical protein CONLIGDRAFT_627854 [Coniochaeta ligniaria NRRL 30616]